MRTELAIGYGGYYGLKAGEEGFLSMVCPTTHSPLANPRERERETASLELSYGDASNSFHPSHVLNSITKIPAIFHNVCPYDHACTL